MSETKAQYITGADGLTKFRPQRKNANKHTQRGMGMLEKSLQKNGWIGAQTAAADGEMIAGSARLEIAADKFADVEPIIVESDGTRPVIVKRIDIPNADDPRAVELSIADNRIAQVDLEWDIDVLKDWNQALDLGKYWKTDELAKLGSEQPEPVDAEPEQARQTLAERFGVPPFSVLDARQGYWQDRKRAWIALGLRGEFGRDKALTYANKNATDEVSLKILGKTGGTSIFDPVLSELLYRWFVPKGGHILNPMSGEATHGIVAGYLGYKFTGVELRAEQAESNRQQAAQIGVDPVWITADALTIDALDIAPADFVVSCPPYADLEVYSDDPLDLSTMEYADFIAKYSEIIKKSCDRLRDNRFACFVVGEVRDKRGIYYDFVGDTIKAFKNAGMKYYNEMILVTAVSNLPIRAGRQFQSSRKIGKTHQNVLVFLKGDSKKAVSDCGEIDMELPDASQND